MGESDRDVTEARVLEGRAELLDDEQTVAAAMLPRPKVLPHDVTVDDVRCFFDDHHVHMALLVDERSPARLVTTLVRDDLPTDDSTGPAAAYGRLAGRTVPQSAALAPVHADLVATGRRRVAVVDGEGVLVGLLCLKHHRGGFCSPREVAARAGS